MLDCVENKIISFIIQPSSGNGFPFNRRIDIIIPPSLFHDQPNDGNKTIPISLTFFEPHHTSNLNLNDVYSLVCIESFW